MGGEASVWPEDCEMADTEADIGSTNVYPSSDMKAP